MCKTFEYLRVSGHFMKNQLLSFIFIIALNQIIYSQESTELIFNPSHTYYREINNSNENERVFVIDKTDSTYFYRYRTFTGCVREFITSKGKVKIKDNIIILKTSQPDVNSDKIFLDYKKRDEIHFDYLKPIESEVNKVNEIKIFVEKTDFIFRHSLDEMKIFVDNNDETNQVLDFKIIDYNNFYYITFEKEKYKEKHIALIIDDENYLINLGDIDYQNFILDIWRYPKHSYFNMTNYKYDIKKRKMIVDISENKYYQWFQSPE